MHPCTSAGFCSLAVWLLCGCGDFAAPKQPVGLESSTLVDSEFKRAASGGCRRAALIGFSLALCFAGWVSIRDYSWVPTDSPAWNPLAIKESGFGRTLARIMTEQ